MQTLVFTETRDQTKPTPRVPLVTQGYSGGYPAWYPCGIMQRQFLPTFSCRSRHDAFCNVQTPGPVQMWTLDPVRVAFCNEVSDWIVWILYWPFVQIIIVMRFATSSCEVWWNLPQSRPRNVVVMHFATRPALASVGTSTTPRVTMLYYVTSRNYNPSANNLEYR